MSAAVLSETRVLLVASDTSSVDSPDTVLGAEADRFRVETAASPEEGLDLLTDRPPDCVVSAYCLPGMDGVEFLEAVREEYPELPFIIFADEGNEVVASEAIAAGVTDYLPRESTGHDRLADRIHRAVEERRETRRADRRETVTRHTEFVADTGGFEVDVETRELLLTEGACRLYGLDTDAELTLEEAFDPVHPADRELLIDRFEECLETGEPYEVDIRFEAAEGEQRWLTASGHRVTNQGSRDVVRGFIQDITDRKQIERSLEQERDLLTGIVDTVPVGIAVVDPDGSFSFVNDQIESIGGRSLEELVDTPHDNSQYDLVDEQGEPLGPDETPFARVLTQEDPIHDQVVGFRRPSGERVWAKVDGAPQYDEDGDLERTVFTLEDITEQRDLEAELSEIFGRISDAFFGLDETFRVTHVNDHAEALMQRSEDELLGEKLWTIYPEIEESDEIWDSFRTAMDTQEPQSLEVSSPQENWYDLMVYPSESGVSVYFRDVTEQKQREEELERKTRAIEEAPVGITLTDPSQSDNPISYVNEKFTSITGYSKAEAAGRNHRFLQGERTGDEPVDTLGTGIRNREQVSAELLNYRKDGTEFWNRVEIAPVRDESGELVNFVGYQQDITDRKERERALEKRERILRELHAATREFYPPESEPDIAEFLVEFGARAFDFECISVKQFDEDEGVLKPVAHSPAADEQNRLGPISPGSNPIWEVYRQGESRLFDGDPGAEGPDVPGLDINRTLVVPVGDFGVTVAYTTGDSEFADVDMDLIDVVAATAESSFQRLRSDSVRTELVEQLSVQRTQIDERQSVIEAVQAIQRRLANSETQDELETGVCEELLETDGVDFAWIARPRGSDTELEATAWAGHGSSYLDSVELGDSDSPLPAQCAAADSDRYVRSNLASLVGDEPWAKEALSADFSSVLSVPLVYDDVLYGVLTAYSRDQDTFGGMYEHLLTDVASLLVNYSRLFEQRYGDTHEEFVELEFELTDSRYPVQRLATETGARIRFDTVIENMTDEIRILITVLDGDVDQVFGAISAVNSIDDAAWFGAHSQCQLSLTIEKPFLASVIGKHGGELVHSVSAESGTTFRVELPKNSSRRPLLEALSSRYSGIEPVAQRHRDTASALGSESIADILTDRQYEVLNAAYHGGYYETPREVTGEDLADTFGISSPAIYNHLQSAHRTLLEAVLESSVGIKDEIGDLNG